MTENQFDHELRARNRWFAAAAIIAVLWGLLLLYGALSIHGVFDRGSAQPSLAYALMLVMLVSNIGTWMAATARRSDLYTIARGNSVTQLKRFRSEIDDVIELLDGEQKAAE